MALEPGEVVKPEDAFIAPRASLTKAYGRLVKEEPIICARTGKELPPIASPDAAVVDASIYKYPFFSIEMLMNGVQCIGYPSLQVVRELSVKPVKVFSWMPSQQSSLVYPLAPVRYGGREDVRPKIREEAARTGRKIEEVLEEVYSLTSYLPLCLT